jgi:hypothetical protein
VNDEKPSPEEAAEKRPRKSIRLGPSPFDVFAMGSAILMAAIVILGALVSWLRSGP